MGKKRKANQIQRVHGVVVYYSTRTWYGRFDKKKKTALLRTACLQNGI